MSLAFYTCECVRSGSPTFVTRDGCASGRAECAREPLTGRDAILGATPPAVECEHNWSVSHVQDGVEYSVCSRCPQMRCTVTIT